MMSVEAQILALNTLHYGLFPQANYSSWLLLMYLMIKPQSLRKADELNSDIEHKQHLVDEKERN